MLTFFLITFSIVIYVTIGSFLAAVLGAYEYSDKVDDDLIPFLCIFFWPLVIFIYALYFTLKSPIYFGKYLADKIKNLILSKIDSNKTKKMNMLSSPIDQISLMYMY